MRVTKLCKFHCTNMHKHHNIDFEQFLVASFDNVDFLQSYTAVYSGDQVCSWHGTTVQVIQHRPIVATEQYFTQ